MKHFALALLAMGAALPACDGQQYVSPDTVALSVTSDSSGVELVNRCHFVPVLLGSVEQARYHVEGDLEVALSVTRTEVRLDYEQPGHDWPSFEVPADTFEDASAVSDAAAPSGYTVVLSSPCTPSDD